MNIQFRDSKTLQDALIKATGRKALPRAQLHPELLEATVDVVDGGFVVKSENPMDREHAGHFLPKGDQCSASWTLVRSGSRPDSPLIPVELVFTLDGGGKLIFRTQAVEDQTKLTSAFPKDHRARFDIRNDGERLVITKSAGEPVRSAREVNLLEQSEGDLRDQAARAGVKWDGRASLETMAKRIAEKKEPAVA